MSINILDQPILEIPANILSLLQAYVDCIELVHKKDIRLKDSFIEKFSENWNKITKEERNEKGRDGRSIDNKLNSLWTKYHDEKNTPRYLAIFTLAKKMRKAIVEKITELIVENPDNNDFSEWKSKLNRNFTEFIWDDDTKKKLINLINNTDNSIEAESMLKVLTKWHQLRNIYEHIEQTTTGTGLGKNVNDGDVRKSISLFLEYESDKSHSYESLFCDSLKCIGDGKDWGELSNPGILTHHLQDVEKRSLMMETRKDAIRRKLNLREWDTYIDIKVKNEWDEEETAMESLCRHIEKGRPVIGIWGEGGLGKTALAFEFINRNLSNKLENIKPFDNVLMMTSKSEEQGEWATERFRMKNYTDSKRNPRNKRINPMMYVEKMKFVSFIENICAMEITDKSGYSTEEKALKVLRENRFLILIDNYEDVTDDEKIKYQKFFDGITANYHSPIIITGRPKQKESYHLIKLTPLNKEAANELFHKRYMYLMTNYSKYWRYRENDFNVIREYEITNKYATLITDILEKDGLERDFIQKFKHFSTHPMVLFYLVSLLGDSELREDLKVIPTDSLQDYILKISQNEKSGFTKYHNNMFEWITDRAYERIEDKPVCVLILKKLLKVPKCTENILTQYVSDNDQIITEVNEALALLLCQNSFIVSDGEYYSLKPQARPCLSRKPEFKDNDEYDHEYSDGHGDFSIPEDEKSLKEILDACVEENSKFPELLANFIKRPNPLYKRKQLNFQTINYGIAILEECYQIELDEKIKALIGEFLNIIRKTIENNCANGNLFKNTEQYKGLGLVIDYLTIETESDFVDSIITQLYSEIIDSWDYIPNTNKLYIIIKQIEINPNMTPEDLFYSWLCLLLNLFRDGIIVSSDEGVRLLNQIVNYSKSTENTSLLFERLTNQQSDLLSNFSRYWSGHNPWNELTYNYMKENNFIRNHNDWTKSSAEWRMYDTTPRFDTEELKDLEYKIKLLSMDGIEITPEVKTTYVCCVDYFNRSENEMILRIINEELEPKIDAELPEDIDSVLKKYIEKKTSKHVYGIVSNGNIGQEVKDKYEKTGITIFKNTEYRSLYNYVVSVIVPMFEGKLSPIENNNFQLREEIIPKENQFKKDAKKWFSGKGKGNLGYPEGINLTISTLKLTQVLLKNKQYRPFKKNGENCTDFAVRMRKIAITDVKRKAHNHQQNLVWVCSFHSCRRNKFNHTLDELIEILIKDADKKISETKMDDGTRDHCQMLIMEWERELVELVADIEYHKDKDNLLSPGTVASLKKAGLVPTYSLIKSALEKSTDNLSGAKINKDGAKAWKKRSRIITLTACKTCLKLVNNEEWVIEELRKSFRRKMMLSNVNYSRGMAEEVVNLFSYGYDEIIPSLTKLDWTPKLIGNCEEIYDGAGAEKERIIDIINTLIGEEE